jgi:hypothetical protein
MGSLSTDIVDNSRFTADNLFRQAVAERTDFVILWRKLLHFRDSVAEQRIRGTKIMQVH